MSALVLAALLIAPAPDYDAAMTPYHAACDAAQNEVASANRFNDAHDKAGTCLALTAAIGDFAKAATAMDPVFALLAGDSSLDDAKRAGLTAQARQAKDAAVLSARGAQADHDRLCS